MDEIDQRARPKRTRVLRATDIIPPFDNLPAVTDAVEGLSESSEPVQAEVGDGEAEIAAMGERDVPKYDLAENILAEQRRVASRRRRAPSQPQEEAPADSPEPSRVSPSLIGLPSEDLPELQRIVAEIVARDIERLCRRPNTN